MREAVQSTFRNLVAFLPSEFAVMELSRWTESVLRYFYCRRLHESFPGVQQFVECNRIDLVLRQGTASAFVEFKFYCHPRQYDPYDGRYKGYKGGPSPKNLKEFRSCVDQLHKRRTTSGLSKYIVLVYADPTDGSRPRLTYSRQYDQYRHATENTPLQLLESSTPFETKDAIVRAHLYEVLCTASAEVEAGQIDPP